MADFIADEAGRLTARIPDATGEPRDYELLPAAPGLAEWAATLRRLDTGSVCRVETRGPALWKCSCAAAKYKGYRKRAESFCKHVAFARCFRALCLTLAPRPQTQGIAS